MEKPGQFYEGQIITLKSDFLKPGSKDFVYAGLPELLRDIQKLTGNPTIPSFLKAKVKMTQASCSGERISVEWLNPFTLAQHATGLTYSMKEHEFQEYSEFREDLNGMPISGIGVNSISSSVVLGHTHVAPGSYTHGYDLGIKYDPKTFEEVNPETNVSFKSTKLVANKIQNPKEIDNFLLTN